MKVSNFQPPLINPDDSQPSKNDILNSSSVKPVPRSPHKRYIIILRCSVLVCILSVAGVMGYFAYSIVDRAEDRQFEHAYSDLIKQLLSATNFGLLKTAAAVMNGAILIGDIYPNSTMWPNVAYNNFPNIAILTSRLSSASGIGFTPIVYPEQVQSFEDFAYDHYSQYPDLYPPGTAEASFGRGIHTYNFTLTAAPDFKYHDTTGDLPWSSPHRFLTPYTQINGPGFEQAVQNSFLMLNLRAFEESVTDIQDAILRCVANRVLLNVTCAMVSGMKQFNPVFQDSPHLYVMQPIIAQDDPHHVLGFVTGTIFFSRIIKEHVPVGTSGIDFVVKMGSQRHTYRITDGVPVYVGTGDFHDSKYDDFGRSVRLVEGSIDPMDGEFTVMHKHPGSSTRITFYPTEEYVSSFRSDLRWIICFGAVTLIMFVTIVFVLYDYFMVRENTEQQAVLETKRQFVRFISHEVRTPLNAVSMAGDLMRDQLVEVLKQIHREERSSPSRSGTSNAAAEATLGEALELCEEILGNTKNAVEVLDDLLNYDKIEVGGLTLTLTFVAMETLLENVLRPFRGPAKQKNVAVVVKVDDYVRHSVFQDASLFGGKFSALRILGDKIRLEQVIRNLVSNALKFTSPHGTIVVTLEWLDGGGTKTAEWLDGGGKKAAESEVVTAKAAAVVAIAPGSPLSSLRRVLDSPSRPRRSYSDLEAGGGFLNRNSQRSIALDSPGVGNKKYLSADSTKMEERSKETIIKSSYTRTPSVAANSIQWGALRFSVKDDGAGMSPEQLRSVCCEGVQFNANELQAGQGSGLGLFIAKGIVKQHNGALTVTSAGLHKGSTFVVELPVYACDVFTADENIRLIQTVEDAAPRFSFGVCNIPRHPPSTGTSFPDLPALTTMTTVEEVSPLPLSQEPQSAKKRRVLVVDDVSSNRKLVIRLLLRRGVEVCEQAGDGQEAIHIYLAARHRLLTTTSSGTADDHKDRGSPLPPESAPSAEPFDAILMDCEMPVMNGPTATKKLRELGCTVPIIGISGNVLPADVQLFMLHGANAVLPKPLDFNELEKVWKTTVSKN